MTFERAIEIIKTEKECVSRNDGVNCDRQCEKCDLILPLPDILCAYDMAIDALGKQVFKQPLKTDCKEFYTCPGCRTLIWRNEQSHGKRDIPHCKWCGQALDWRN